MADFNLKDSEGPCVSRIYEFLPCCSRSKHTDWSPKSVFFFMSNTETAIKSRNCSIFFKKGRKIIKKNSKCTKTWTNIKNEFRIVCFVYVDDHFFCDVRRQVINESIDLFLKLSGKYLLSTLPRHVYLI